MAEKIELSDGWYWVKPSKYSEWQTAQLCGGMFYLSNKYLPVQLKDSFLFHAIDHNRIPTPDEQFPDFHQSENL